jgi:APA family basic amino acid/polyamine antiporter
MRYTHNDIPRSFQVPYGPWLVPILGILLCILLLINTTGETAIRLGIWIGVGHVVYFSYSFWNSKGHLKQQQYLADRAVERVPPKIFVIPGTPETDSDSEVVEETYL